MAATEPTRRDASIPMTLERAMTAVARTRVAVQRAHRELSEAMEIADGLAGNGIRPSTDDPSDRASKVLRLPSVLKRLDEMDGRLAAGQDGNGEEWRVKTPRKPPRRPISQEPVFEGEFPEIPEQLVVAPCMGPTASPPHT